MFRSILREIGFVTALLLVGMGLGGMVRNTFRGEVLQTVIQGGFFLGGVVLLRYWKRHEP